MHVAGIMPRNVADINVNTFKFSNPENLKGNDAHYNANKIIDVFSGEKNEFS